MVDSFQAAVAVITGASSGIGRETAYQFAREGAKVALAARRARPLEEAAEECRRLGGEAIVVPTDVTDMAQVETLARAAVETFGRIDVWVTCAAVAAFGSFADTPLDVFRRILDVNVMGTVHSARAAHPIFRQQGSGHLITISSVLGKTAVPALSAYNASKFAVLGLTESLREEWEREGLHVSTVLPPPTDTPFYIHAANYTGKAVRPPPPVYAPETVAQAIVECARRPRREVKVGMATNLQALTHAIAPRLYERVTEPYIEHGLFVDAPQFPTHGNVFEPMEEGDTVTGGWKEGWAPAKQKEREWRPGAT